ncbi:DNA polymerase [Cyclospora cayetanensis]|uniref:DNA polymerase n=1 Tax=Cyclospora cayetanensis TaxID=88456 RepID=A0A1D3D797_9EIME|nr:DNA polymerase [Cyclospora cayetanensis]
MAGRRRALGDSDMGDASRRSQSHHLLSHAGVDCPHSQLPRKSFAVLQTDGGLGGSAQAACCSLPKYSKSERLRVDAVPARVSMLAQLLAHSPHLYVDQQTLRGREDMQWQLAQLSLIPQATMLAAVREGVAYHHAGLSGEERECVENGYRRGYLSVLCATTTLALGVNLPAARVIVRAPHVGRNELLSAARFQQMAGRAGRKGLEHRGEAYIICSADTLPHVQDLVKTVAAAASPERSSSTGTKGSVAAGVSALKGQHLCRFLLETVHVLLPLLRRGWEGFSRNTDGGAFGDIAAVLLQCTLRSRQESHASLVEEAAAAVRYLHTCFLLEAEAASASPPCCAMQQQFQGPSNPWLCCSGASAHEKPAVHNSARPAPHANLANAPPELVEAAHTTPSQTCRFPLRALAFPPSTLPAPCQALLQRYPCLRSPAVLARMLQAALYASDNAEAMPDSAPLLHAAPRGPPDAAPHTTSHLPASSKHPPQSRGATGQSSRAPMLSSRDEEAFAARLRLHFSALDELAAQLEGKTHPARVALPSAAAPRERPVEGRSSDVDVEGGKAGGEGGRRLALTEAGAATVEAGLAPWEGAELYADIFKTSVLGLCATNELHIIFLAAVSVGGDAQPHWRCYLSVYDSLDPACRKVADALGIRRQVICREAMRFQGTPRRSANDTADRLLHERLTFGELCTRIETETHRRFFFALLLHDVYCEGEASKFYGISSHAVQHHQLLGGRRGRLLGMPLKPLLHSALSGFLIVCLRAALSEVFSMLAGKLKLACLPVGALVSKFKDLADTQTKGSCFASNSDARRDAIVLQQFLQLEGMTPRRATALRAIQVNTCEELLNTPVYDIFKALEAAEPAFLTAADHNAEANQDAWLCKMRRQRARLLAVAVKLKDAAQKEQAMRLQALEDEAAGHWSLAEKLSEQSGDEEGSVASQQHSCLQSTDHEPTANCKS